MGYILPTINATSVPSTGLVVDLQTEHAGTAVIYNFSAVCFSVSTTSPGSSKFLAALTADLYSFDIGQRFVTLTPLFSLSLSGAPTNLVIAVDEDTTPATLGGTWPLYLGGIVNVAAFNSLVNDGNPAGTTIVEATPTGAGSSQVLLTNDGKLFLGSYLEYGSTVTVNPTPTLTGALYVSTTINSGILTSPLSGASNGLGFACWTGAARVFPFSIGSQIGSAPTWIDQSGVVKQVAGQATAGNFGVPVVVAQSLDQHITITGFNAVVSFTPGVAGFYRVSGSIKVGAAGNITATTVYDDAHGGTPTATMIAAVNSFTALNASAQASGASLPLMPQTMWAGTGHAVSFGYTNSAASPNDFVTAIIERLA